MSILNCLGQKRVNVKEKKLKQQFRRNLKRETRNFSKAILPNINITA